MAPPEHPCYRGPMQRQATPAGTGGPTLSEAELDATAAMARLRLSDAERERLRSEVQQILAYFDVMAALDLSGVEPTTHALQPRNRLRPDQVVAADRRWPGATPESLLAAAPECEDDHFSVPNVL